MATSGRVNTNTIYTGTTYWYIETYWRVTGWGTGNNANLANIEWKAYLRRSSGSKTQVQSYDVGGNVNGDVHSWRVQSGTMYKDQELGSGTLQQWGSNPVRVVTSGHIYGSGSNYKVSADQTWTLDNNITTPSCSCSITSISENSISASLTVTNSGNASITENTLEISTSSNFSSVQTVNGTTATWKNLSLNTQYYVRARVKNAGNIYSSYSTPTTQPHTWNKPTIKSIAVANLIAGNSQTVTLNNSHNRSCTIKVLKGSTVLYSGTTSGTTLTFTIPADKCRIALGTDSDSTTEVSIQYSCIYSSWSDTTAANAYKLKNNTAYKPTWNSNFTIDDIILYGDQVTSVVNITGDNHILVQGKSNWSGGADFYLQGGSAAIPNGNSGSSIEKYEVVVDQEDPIYVNPGNIGTIPGGAVATGVSTISIKIKAIDYKGVSSDVRTKTIITTPYAVPTGTITAKRQNNYGTTVELTINPTWAVSSRNAGTATWSYKLSTDSSWTTPGGTLNPINQFNTPVALGVSFDNALSYEFKVVLTDAFGGSSTAEIKTSVGPGMPIFFIDETVNGVGVNDIPTEQGLFVDGKTNIKGATTIGTSSAPKNLTVTGTMTGKLINDYSGYVTSGTDGLSSYWFKVWDGTFTSVQYDDKCYTLQINGGYNTYWGQICFRVRQNGANGGGAYNLTCQLYRLSGSIPLSNMRLYYNNSTGVCSLWANCTARYNTFNYQIISKTGRTTKEQAPYGTFYSGNYTTAQTLPSGSYITMIDITVLNAVYPVGSIYMSVNSTSPATLFGGTWERLPKGKFLYNIDSDSAAWGNGNSTGTATNAATGNTGATTLTAGQSGLRSHQHKIYGGWNNGGSGDDAYGYSSAYGGDRGWKTYGMETVGDSSATSSHTHTLNSHTHNIPYIAIYMWRRTA